MKDRNYLINAYNADITVDENGKIEYYKSWLEKQLLSRIEELEQLRICAVSCQREQFSLVDLKQAFEEGEKHKHECSANGKDKKCYCKHVDDCNWRNQQTFEEWMKSKENCN